MIFYISATFVSLALFLGVLHQVTQHRKTYNLPMKLALNCRVTFFKKRYILLAYLSLLVILSIFTGIVIFYPYI